MEDLQHPNTPEDIGAETIKSFCLRFNISQAHYFAEARLGRMPATIRVGKRTLIPHGAIRRWLEEKLTSAAA